MATSRVLVAPDPSHLAPRSFLRPHDFLLPYILEWEGDTDAPVVAAMAAEAAAKPNPRRRRNPQAEPAALPPSGDTLPTAIDNPRCVVCGGALPVKKPDGEAKQGQAGRTPKASRTAKPRKPPAPWCYPCLMARTRLSARRQLLAASRPNTTQAPCALCGGTPETVLAVEDIFANRKKASAFGDPAGWVRRDTPWVCLPCASVYAVTGVKFGKLSTFAFAAAPDGSLQAELQREVPWWEAPPCPCLVVYHRGKTGGIVQRLARTEVSVDPTTVVVNIIDSTARYPTRLTFPRPSPALQAAIDRAASALAAMPETKDKTKPPEFWTALNALRPQLLPQAGRDSPLWAETRLQLLRRQGILRASTKEGL